MSNPNSYGTNGKQLWIRTPDDRWAPVPYGAGQDDTLRSINIWDAKAKAWKQPTWGWSVWKLDGEGGQVESLEMYAPGVSWIGAANPGGSQPYYNPNYLSGENQRTFTPLHDDWVRLFHLWERRTPNWRIVSGRDPVPSQVPNVTTAYNGRTARTRPLWPLVGRYHYSISRSADDGSQTVRDSFDSQVDFDDAYLSGAGRLVSYGRGTSVKSPVTSSNGSSETITVSMIDLKAIRQRLLTTYREQGLDFTGTYDPIELMSVRRVYVHGTVQVSFGAISATADATAYAQGNYRLYAQTHAPGTAYAATHPDWPDTCSVRYPASTIPTGSIVFDRPGTAMSVTASASTPASNPNFHYYVVGGSHLYTNVTFEFVEPGEDNISFYGSVENTTEAGGGTYSLSHNISFNINQLTIHYSVAPTDTPAETHTWSAIG